jgi:methyl-accepting chemotaxis protein
MTIKTINRKIAFRLLKWAIPLLVLFLIALSWIIYVVESNNQESAMTGIGGQATEQTAIALENWISDQIRMVQMISRDERVVQACENPGDHDRVQAAHLFLKSLHQQFPFYENLPLASKMTSGSSTEISVNGTDKMVSDGQFFTDTVGGKTIGKCSPKMSYIKAIYEGKDYFISQVYPSLLRGNPIFVISAPVKNSAGHLVGVAIIAPQMSYFTDLFVNSIKVGKTGYLFFIDDRGMILSHPKAEFTLNKDMVSKIEHISSNVLSGKHQFTADFEQKTKYYISRRIDLPEDNLLHKWYMVFTQEQSEILSTSKTFLTILSGLSVVFLLLFSIGIYLLCRLIIVKPVRQAIVALKDIAQGEGDLTKRIEIQAQDEIGELAGWFNTFIEKLQGIIKKVAENSSSVDASATGLSAIANQMASGSDNSAMLANDASTSATEMSKNLDTIVSSIKESSTNASMVAAASEEMNATIGEIAKNAENGRSISDQAVSKAKDASSQMNELGDAAQSIGKVVETINDISEQVNLLALNATIEAARAGDAGKGFAVVANEIKDLAKQTASATQEIKSKIENIQGSTANTIAVIDEIGGVIDSVNDLVSSIATAVEEQSSVTREIADNIGQASHGINQVSTNVTQSSAVASEISDKMNVLNQSAGEMSTSSSQVKMSAEELQQMATDLNKIVGSFKV